MYEKLDGQQENKFAEERKNPRGFEGSKWSTSVTEYDEWGKISAL